MYRSARQTGRTTRMLKDAVATLYGGKEVVVQCISLRQAQRFAQLLDQQIPEHEQGKHKSRYGLIYVAPNGCRLQFVYGNFDFTRFRPYGGGILIPRYTLFVDHTVIEDRLPKLLHELHRYDAPLLTIDGKPGR